MEKRQDTRLRINGLNAALVEDPTMARTALVATQDYLDAMRESNDNYFDEFRAMKNYTSKPKPHAHSIYSAEQLESKARGNK